MVRFMVSVRLRVRLKVLVPKSISAGVYMH